MTNLSTVIQDRSPFGDPADYVRKDGAAMTGTLTVKAVFEDVVALSGATPTFSVSAAQVGTLTTSADTTVAISGTVAGKAWRRSIRVTMGGAHTFAITGADWGDDGPPTGLATGDEMTVDLDGIGADFNAVVSFRKTA